MNAGSALPMRLRRRIGSAGGAVADQVLSSGTGLLLVVLVARDGTPEVFGALSVAMIVHGLGLGVLRSTNGEISLLRCRERPAEAPREAALGLWIALVAGAAAALALGLVSRLITGDVGDFLLVVAVAAPFVYAQDLLRFLAYGRGRIGDAIVIDGIWFGTQVVASATLILLGEASALRFAGAWLVGAMASAAFGVARGTRPGRSGAGQRWIDERSRAGGFVGDYLVSTGMVQVSFLLIGIVLPLADFGALRAAFVSLSPLANVLAGVRTLVLAHLGGSQDDPARARRAAVRFSTCLAAAGTVYGVGLVLLPDDWGVALLGETWLAASSLVGFVAIGEIFRLSSFAAIDFTKVFGTPVQLVRSRITAGSGVVIGLLSGALLGGPRGAAMAAAAAYGFATVVWWYQVRHLAGTVAQQLPDVRS